MTIPTYAEIMVGLQSLAAAIRNRLEAKRTVTETVLAERSRAEGSTMLDPLFGLRP